ncbi:hypothetical protein ONS95_010123 [Cadophora gregata]|uniref:uncharacterized protein n=1 Tax=Cadophora gregata TaxID=51156 RepID=UPI0026DBF18C|nr:uncharacterized protein ONS95_010123 [Cadophora gregata]KAK0121843.1 hypothetical protein ONS95_010123 [Cadophora gregata]KAK0127322.1 hypothetical protein ONS96_006870 [Cadophora gregata f. sp. sojae]
MPGFTAQIRFSGPVRDSLVGLVLLLWDVFGWAGLVPVAFLLVSWGVQFGFGVAIAPLVCLILSTVTHLASLLVSWFDPREPHRDPQGIWKFWKAIGTILGLTFGVACCGGSFSYAWSTPNKGNIISFLVHLFALVATAVFVYGEWNGWRKAT